MSSSPSRTAQSQETDVFLPPNSKQDIFYSYPLGWPPSTRSHWEKVLTQLTRPLEDLFDANVFGVEERRMIATEMYMRLSRWPPYPPMYPGDWPSIDYGRSMPPSSSLRRLKSAVRSRLSTVREALHTHRHHRGSQSGPTSSHRTRVRQVDRSGDTEERPVATLTMLSNQKTLLFHIEPPFLQPSEEPVGSFQFDIPYTREELLLLQETTYN